MRAETANWLAASQYDVTTAEHMLDAGRYLYVVFMCHLAMEKSIKAAIQEDSGKLPPKTHDLVYLAGLAGLKFPEPLLDFVGRINSASIVTRYPEDLVKAISAYPEGVVREYLEKTKEILLWLRRDPRLKQS